MQNWKMIEHLLCYGDFVQPEYVYAMDKIEHTEEIHVWNITECCSMATIAFNIHTLTPNWPVTIHFKCLSFVRIRLHLRRISYGYDFESFSIFGLKKKQILCLVYSHTILLLTLTLSRNATNELQHFPFTDYFDCM